MRTTELTFGASDGAQLGAVLGLPDADGPVPGVVSVAGSRHERDAWLATCSALAERGVASLQLDIRGRGRSVGDATYARMGPGERRRVALDVAAALDALGGADGVDATRLGLLTEQDTAADAVRAADHRVQAIAILSARHPQRLAAAIAELGAPVLGMVSTEDREGLRATVGAYLAAPEEGSRLEVYEGLGIGITMASVLQFEQPDATPIEVRIATWVADTIR